MAMASRKPATFAIFAQLLLLALAFPSITAYKTNETQPAEKKHAKVVVEAMVYCQSCNYIGSWSLTGAAPIPSAKVSVICKDAKNLVSFYKAFEADQHGYVYAHLDGFGMKHGLLDHPLQACRMKLVSSSLANCSLLSYINYDGNDGAPLRYENKVLRGTNYEAVIYAAGPLAFLPAHCPPKTYHA